jgi:hypothetical protein
MIPNLTESDISENHFIKLNSMVKERSDWDW